MLDQPTQAQNVDAPPVQIDAAPVIDTVPLKLPREHRLPGSTETYVLLALLTGIAGHAFVLGLWRLVQPESRLWLILLGLGGAILFWFTARLLIADWKAGIHSRFFAAKVLASLAGISVAAIASVHSIVEYFVPPEPHAAPTTGLNVGLLLIGLLASIPLVLVLHKTRSKFLGIRTFGQSSHGTGHGGTPAPSIPLASGAGACAVHVHLILPLSVPNAAPEVQNGELRFTALDKSAVSIDLKADIVTVANSPKWNRHNWQQMVRALVPYRDCLRSVHLIGSAPTAPAHPEIPGAKPVSNPIDMGSEHFLPQAGALLRQLLPTGVSVVCRPCEPKLDFTKVERLQAALLVLIEEIEAANRGTPIRIVVDTTAGLKTTSIAGALCTLSNETVFQYVNTNPPFEATVFELGITTAPDIGAA